MLVLEQELRDDARPGSGRNQARAGDQDDAVPAAIDICMMLYILHGTMKPIYYGSRRILGPQVLEELPEHAEQYTLKSVSQYPGSKSAT